MQRAASLLTPIWGVNSRPLVGMVHLLPLPGAPRWDGSMSAVIGRARADAAALAAGGFHGVMVENFLDAPFHPAAVPAETVAAMAVIVDRVREECGLPVGVNVLRNDAYAALAIAAATSARFIRVNVHTGAMLTDQGWLDGRAHETLRTRLRLAPDVAILAAELAAADAKVKLAEAGNVADPSGRVGLRHFGEGNDVAVMVGGSIPLGTKTANRGNVARAQAEKRAIEADVAVTRVEIEREIGKIVADRQLIASEVKRIDAEVLPSATRAVRLIRDGLARGGTAFTFLEFSQAQTAVSDARARRIELLRRFHLLGVRLDRLTGRHAPLLAKMETIR